ncbi:hypothetical protein E1551_04205 [Shigella sonnei]|nr:hypothetical protein [Shigella sonnei]EFP7216428.1 hypothetical protein [Shigella sonnei]EFQ0602855.1 hypothetical protein [Shigella sonnei]EFV9263206.1 hypothetical protein [Shigella sonnei]EFW9459237.1 hypothetical protein [Shigella sonnei]
MILDSRPVHAARPHSEAIRDAQRKKPKVPVHAVLTATNYSAAIFLIPICISFDTAEKRRYATYLILNRRFSFEF